MKQNIETSLKFILVISLLIFALTFMSGFSKPGIKLSCEEKKIIGFSKVPPPLFAIIQPEICRIEIQASVNNMIVCSGTFRVLNIGTGTFPCENLENHKNETILIKATFFDVNGSLIGEDIKTLVYRGI